MRFTFLLTALLFLQLWSFSQCAVEHWSLEKRIHQSELVVEGRIISKVSQWDSYESNIYTVNTIEVYRVFKGNGAERIELITLGGQVGLERHEANPSLQLELGDVGVFLLNRSNIQMKTYNIQYVGTANYESFIKYDEAEVMAYDADQTYYSINHDLYSKLQSISGQELKLIKVYDAEAKQKVISPLAIPSITGFDLDTVSSGTGTMLTITGSNFGLVRGTGKVGFKDANYGDGRFYYSPISASYESWSNSKIEVYVPTRAGTGKIQVINNDGDQGQSSDELYVKWAHSNVLFGTASVDTNFYENTHINHNGQGGYTWQMTDNFASKNEPVMAFYRSLETWRCGTLMNWKVGSDTSLDQTASDDVNVVRFDDLTGSTLGRCWSRWSGCYSSTNQTYYWYVKELDIEFDSTYNWFYGTGNPASNQYHFQSVSAHELGHGHQLSHVRDNSKMMHYSIGAGDRKPDLSLFDVEGGDYVVLNSSSSSTCGNSAMNKLSTGNCQITLPIVSFNVNDTVVCVSDNVTFTNTTDGSGLSFLWNFGADASTASAISEGPHTLSYSSSGTKRISLLVTNSFGVDSLVRTIEVLPPTPATPDPFITEDTACFGENTYTVGAVANATGYAWAVPSGGSFVGGSTGSSVKVDWNAAGLRTVRVVALGQCGNSDPRVDSLVVVEDPMADFDLTDDGLSVQFTSSSSNAENFEWDFGDGSSSTEENPSHDYPDQGSYTVTLKVTNYCGSDSLSESVDLNFKVGIRELNSALIIVPNPSKSEQEISFGNQIIDHCEIRDLHGRILFASRLKANYVLLPKLSDGLYVIRLQQGDKHFDRKLLIKNN